MSLLTDSHLQERLRTWVCAGKDKDPESTPQSILFGNQILTFDNATRPMAGCDDAHPQQTPSRGA